MASMAVMPEPVPAADEPTPDGGETVAAPASAGPDAVEPAWSREDDAGSAGEPPADRQSWQATWRKAAVLLVGGLAVAGAIVLARIPLVVWGMNDPLRGGAISRFQILQSAELNHRCQVISGVLEEECAAIIKDFFKKRRIENKSDDETG